MKYNPFRGYGRKPGYWMGAWHRGYPVRRRTKGDWLWLHNCRDHDIRCVTHEAEYPRRIRRKLPPKVEVYDFSKHHYVLAPLTPKERQAIEYQNRWGPTNYFDKLPVYPEQDTYVDTHPGYRALIPRHSWEFYWIEHYYTPRCKRCQKIHCEWCSCQTFWKRDSRDSEETRYQKTKWHRWFRREADRAIYRELIGDDAVSHAFRIKGEWID